MNAFVYPLIMMTALLCGAILSRRYKSSLHLAPSQKLWIAFFGFSGAMLFARLPFLLRWPGFQGATGFLISGKTILFGLVGGYAGVELAKRLAGIRQKTGDMFVVPVAVSIGIGRLACFFGGCCYGVPTSLPWGVTFAQVDRFPRHPIQLYEVIFHFTLAAVCAVLFELRRFPRQLIKLYFIAYFIFRFLTEFLRPEIPVAFGLTVYQWAALLLCALFIWLWYRDAKPIVVPSPPAISS